MYTAFKILYPPEEGSSFLISHYAIMKKTLFIAISLLGGITASAETVILDVTNNATTSYDSPTQIISLGDKENSSTPDSIRSASFTLNGATVTATFETGYGSARNYLSSSNA